MEVGSIHTKTIRGKGSKGLNQFQVFVGINEDPPLKQMPHKEELTKSMFCQQGGRTTRSVSYRNANHIIKIPNQS